MLIRFYVKSNFATPNRSLHSTLEEFFHFAKLNLDSLPLITSKQHILILRIHLKLISRKIQVAGKLLKVGNTGSTRPPSHITVLCT